MSTLLIFDVAENGFRPLRTTDLGSGGGGGGDASAANQTTQIGIETAIRDRLPASLGAKAASASLAVTLAADGAGVQALGAPADASAGTDTGSASMIGLLKRLLSVKLPTTLGNKAAGAALATVGTPFEPIPGSTVSHSCSTTALAAVACTAGEVLRFGVAGAAAIGIRFGTSTVAVDITAATAMDIMPGTAEAFTVPAGATHWSAIMASGTGTLKVTRGAGV